MRKTNRGDSLKNSIAKRITRRISLLLLVAFVILLVSSFLLVSNIINTKNGSYSRALVSVYGDLVTDTAITKNEPLDTEHTADSIRYGKYLCKWLNVDNVYIYSLDLENNTRTFVCIVTKTAEDIDDENADHYIGYSFERTPTQSEIDVWNEKTLFGNMTTNNDFGNEICTLMLIKDGFGNKYIVGLDMSYENANNQIAAFFHIAFAIIAVVIAIIYYAVFFIIRKQVSNPIQKISRAMNNYTVDGKKSAEKLETNGTGEYDMIADAFNTMTDDIDSYLENIRSLTKEQESRKAEVDIAARIQRSLLPEGNYSSFCYDINAVMKPAQNIGGDLYYYYPLDSDRVLVVVADVSGKGIPAAMFMTIILTTVYQFAKMNLTPEEILEKTNSSICENNKTLMFATAFIGIFNSVTKEFTYANAGHNTPYVVGKTLEKLESQSGAPVGLFENERYPQSSVKLEEGDSVFIFTDGVNEAINSKKEFFGTRRLENALEKYNRNENGDLISYISDSLGQFTQDVSQFDDITMLVMNVKSKNELLLDYDVHEFEKIKSKIFSLPLSKAQQLNLILAAEEYFVNICSYAYTGEVPEGEKIKVSFNITDKVVITFEDGGKPFNPLELISGADDFDIDNDMGGLGRFIALSNVDDAYYKYENSKNILTVTKRIEEENK